MPEVALLIRLLAGISSIVIVSLSVVVVPGIDLDEVAFKGFTRCMWEGPGLLLLSGRNLDIGSSDEVSE